MTSSSDTFPFGIADVVELLGLTVHRRLPSSLYLNCPFCGDQRGLTEKQIARFGFKSAPPAFLCRSYSQQAGKKAPLQT